MISIRTLMRVAALGVLLGFPAVSSALRAAEQPPIWLPGIRVQDEQLRSYAIGEQFKFNVNQEDLERQRTLEGTGDSGPLRIRIIRGSKAQLVREMRYPLPDGCLIYRGALFRVSDYNGGLRVLYPSQRRVYFNDQWLRASSEDRVSSQTFVLIFEAGPLTGKGLLKLRPEDANDYFAGAWQFVVKAPGRRIPPKRIKSLTDQQTRARSETASLYQRMAQDDPEPTLPERPRCTEFSRLILQSAAVLNRIACRGGRTGGRDPFLVPIAEVSAPAVFE